MEEGHEIEGDIARLRAFKCPAWKRVLYHALGVLTLGLLYLVAFWSNGVRLALTYSDCGLADADAVYVQLKDKRAGICQVKRLPRDGDHQQQQQRYFEFHKVRFLWLETQHAFRAAPDTPPALPRLALECASAVEEQAEHQHGPHGSAVGAAPSPAPAPGPACPPEDVRTRHAAEYGANVLSVDPPSAVRIFLHDALQPFYVFQYFSVVLWAFEDYYLYSGIVLLITMGSIIANVWSQYIERKRMAELAYHVEDVTLLVSDVNHARSRTVMRLAGSSADLVPGDVIVVVPGKVPCDILLLSGECVADETVLTGECVPVRKVAYAPEGDGGSYHPDSLPQMRKLALRPSPPRAMGTRSKTLKDLNNLNLMALGAGMAAIAADAAAAAGGAGAGGWELLREEFAEQRDLIREEFSRGMAALAARVTETEARVAGVIAAVATLDARITSKFAQADVAFGPLLRLVPELSVAKDGVADLDERMGRMEKHEVLALAQFHVDQGKSREMAAKVAALTEQVQALEAAARGGEAAGRQVPVAARAPVTVAQPVPAAQQQLPGPPQPPGPPPLPAAVSGGGLTFAVVVRERVSDARHALARGTERALTTLLGPHHVTVVQARVMFANDHKSKVVFTVANEGHAAFIARACSCRGARRT
ncbi:hypothetical protein FOA52_008263 [Chlamydomonas sp. UWO 241]|nr:hypothetical protein FOA52_008263 [Chlamydomonas sp. UWO 241]